MGESYWHLKPVTAQPADVFLGSSFPQQSEQLQCETLGQPIFPAPEPDLCLLHRNFQPGHSWGHIWTETHRSHHPGEGASSCQRTTVPLGLCPNPGGDRDWAPLPRQTRLGRSGMLREGKESAKNPSQTAPDLLYHGGQLPSEHRLLFIHKRGIHIYSYI